MSNSYETDSVHQILEARITGEKTKSGFDVEENEPIAVFRIRSLQPGKCLPGVV